MELGQGTAIDDVQFFDQFVVVDLARVELPQESAATTMPSNSWRLGIVLIPVLGSSRMWICLRAGAILSQAPALNLFIGLAVALVGDFGVATDRR